MINKGAYLTSEVVTERLLVSSSPSCSDIKSHKTPQDTGCLVL